MTAIAFALLLAAAPAQAVYKCVDAKGVSAYSAEPCAKDAAPVKLRREKDGDPNAGRDNSAGMIRSNERSTIQRAEQTCITNAQDNIIGSANQRAAAMRGQINDLQRSIGQANNNLAGATYASGLRQQISGLEVAMATERTAASAMFNLERGRCIAQRQADEAAFREKYPDQP